VTDGCDGLLLLVEVAHDVQHFGVQANVLGRAAPRDDQAVVVCGVDGVEICGDGEVVAWLFGVGLVTLEVVDGGGDDVAGLLARAHGVHGVADHQQHLERDHGLVVFDEVADEHENFFGGHVFLLVVRPGGAVNIACIIPREKRPHNYFPGLCR